MDLLGGVFCTLSLAYKTDFDALAAVNYAGIVVLDGGILVLAAILNPRASRRRRRLQALESPTTGDEGHAGAAPKQECSPDVEKLVGHTPAEPITSSLHQAEKEEVSLAVGLDPHDKR